MKNYICRSWRTLSTEGPKVDVDDRLQDLHNAPINVNFELGGGWVGGGGLGKGWGFDLKVLFWVKCPRDIVDHHIWWKENKFPTPPISVRLEVKGVWLKVATYQHSLFPKRYILLICWKNLENCELKPKFMHWTFQWADGWEKKNEHFETPK